MGVFSYAQRVPDLEYGAVIREGAYVSENDNCRRYMQQEWNVVDDVKCKV